MKLAIVILNWNGQNLLENFLPSIVKFTSNHEIYVIDNQSNDDSILFLKNNFPTVKIIENGENLGFTGGYNLGLKNIDANLFCLINNDVEVTENWTEPIINLFRFNAEIASVQPKILDYKNKEYFEYAGAGGGFLDNFGYPYCRGRVFWTMEKDENQFNDTIEVDWASGACMFIRKEDFFDVNGFDESFFAHMEEIDLCWRLRNLGKKIFYCGESTVYHQGGATLAAQNPKKTYLNFRNSLFMLVKNLPAVWLFPIIFTRLILDGLTAIIFWRYEGFSHLKAIFHSHIDFYRGFLNQFKKREKTTSKYFKHRIIPWQYFILKRKKFEDLA